MRSRLQISPGVGINEVHDHDERAWDRMLSIRGEVEGLNVKAMNVYAPLEEYSTAAKDELYGRLRKCSAELGKFKGGQYVLLCDFKAVYGRLNASKCGDACGKNNPMADFTSENGARLLNFCKDRGLANTCCTSRRMRAPISIRLANVEGESIILPQDGDL